MFVTIITFIVIGLIAGAVARLLVPGRDPMGIIATILLGIAGSFVGGFLAALIFGGRLALNAAGIIGSIVGAVILVLILRLVRSRGVA